LKLLLHTCCAPCAIYPVQILRQKKIDVMGFFYRHNIHPFQECLKREETLKNYSKSIDLKVIYQKDYKLENFLQSVVFREKDRCRYCYHARLKAAALVAKKGNFEAFSTTLLYSKFQNHDLIRNIGEAVAKEYHLKFYYHDFREGWKSGIDESKKLEMYRQQYCGCIYSEKERYSK
jgi:predicted adenine nucleotide alpha hydrolase (AANH) superfamily ATPase